MPRTLRARFRHEIEPIKGSRFIATVAPVPDEAAARTLLAEVAGEWPDASHHCWAWRLATPAVDRAGDDGEPSGSAGRPILAAITGRDLLDTAVVVTRWFGGTKLGVGGLVRAYGGAAAAALDRTETDPWVELVAVRFTHDHAEVGAVDRLLARLDLDRVTTTWGGRVERTVTLPVHREDELAGALADLTQGRSRVIRCSDD